jgi:hypothetical protein
MKTERPNESANRREFLRSSARYALLAGLAAVSAVLVKRGGAGLSNQTCINKGICRGCGVFEECGLPQALSAKQVLQSRSSRGDSAQTSSKINQSRLTSAATSLEKGGKV